MDVEQWRATFEVFDSDQKGKIDSEKIRRVFADFGHELNEQQLQSMLSSAGCVSSRLTLAQFAGIMTLQFQPELWRMARTIAEQRLAIGPQSGSKLLDLNFIARARQTQADADSEDEQTKIAPHEHEAAQDIP